VLRVLYATVTATAQNRELRAHPSEVVSVPCHVMAPEGMYFDEIWCGTPKVKDIE
jgi:hypothetical protein